MGDRWKKGNTLEEPCPLCGGVLVVRENAKEGTMFVGCLSFPSCRMNRPLQSSDKKSTDSSRQDDEVTELVDEQAKGYTGTICSVCHEPQFRSPGGLTCANGHGGALAVDSATGDVVDVDDPDTMSMVEAMHKMVGGCTPDPSLFAPVQEMPDRNCQLVTTPDLADVLEEDGGYRLHVEIALDPVDTDLEVQRVDADPVGVSIDLDRARMRREAGHDVATEVVGRLLPRLIEAVRRVLW